MLGGLGGFYAVKQDIKREEACVNDICLKDVDKEVNGEEEN